MLGCGDLPFDYLEYLVSRLDVPLLYVPGNHDPSLAPPDTTWTPLRAEPLLAPGPAGCVNIDGRLVEVRGLRIAGLGGSVRYKEGPHQYSQRQMGRRALKLEFRTRLGRVRNGRKLDVLVTHAPPFGLAEAKRGAPGEALGATSRAKGASSPLDVDGAHAGFVAFLRLIRNLHPLLAVHGHIHPYGRTLPEGKINSTRVINAVPSRLIEI